MPPHDWSGFRWTLGGLCDFYGHSSSSVASTFQAQGLEPNSAVSLNNVRKCLKWFTFPFFSLCRSTFGKLHVSWLKILGAHPNWKCFPLLPLTCPPSCVRCRQVVLFLTCTSFWCHLVMATAFCVCLAFIFSTPLLLQQKSHLGWSWQSFPTCQREKEGGGLLGLLRVQRLHTIFAILKRSAKINTDLDECGLCPYQFPPSQIGSDDI